MSPGVSLHRTSDACVWLAAASWRIAEVVALRFGLYSNPSFMNPITRTRVFRLRKCHRRGWTSRCPRCPSIHRCQHSQSSLTWAFSSLPCVMRALNPGNCPGIDDLISAPSATLPNAPAAPGRSAPGLPQSWAPSITPRAYGSVRSSVRTDTRPRQRGPGRGARRGSAHHSGGVRV